MGARTFGVEEELLLVDPGGEQPRAVSGEAIRFAREHGGAPSDRSWNAGLVETEFQRQQLEICTPPCSSLDELCERIRDLRRAASAAAAQADAAVAALATCPLKVRPTLTPSPRYRRMSGEYALTADEQLTCACHVHVSVESPDEGVAVLDRIRPWLPPLLAMTANSPFWQGRDSGYVSWRQQVWGRWPSSGPTELFGSATAYRDTVRALLATDTLVDEGMVYFDARLSRHYPTVEVRVADVCLDARDTVLTAALVRALVDTAAAEWRAGRPPDTVRTDLLRMAMWRASRSGIEGELIHPVAHRSAPAREVVETLLAHVTDALDRHGDLETAERLIGRLWKEGSGAHRQRAVHDRTGRLDAVVADAIEQTC